MPQYTNAWDNVLPRLQQALYGEFVISRELGRGGMAAVFLAHQLRLNRKVAIKVMAPAVMSGLGSVDRFRDEATTVARLDHPNIIAIFEVGAAADLQYFVMPYVAGRSLERVMRQYGRLSLDVARAILSEVGSALAYAHRHGVIHRDVKPGNILLSLEGRAIVSDFGIAKVTESTARTQTGAVVGTPAYMSPEQCLGRSLTWAADQYSLGVVAYEMLTGEQPFVGSSYVVMRGHTEDPPPSLLARRPDCPVGVASAIERMLAKDPAARFASMSDALNALGASRAAVDDVVQAAIGQLAIPLRHEEGVVLVDTPASPVPRQAPPNATEGRVDGTEAAGELSMGRLRGRAVAALAAVRSGARRWRAAGAAGAALTLVLIAVVATRARTGVQGRPAPQPPQARTDTALGTVPGITPVAGDSASAATADTLSDSLATEQPSAAAVDSTAPNSLTIARLGRLEVGDSVRLLATIRDLKGRVVRGSRITWTVDSRRTVAVDSSTGFVKGLLPGSAVVSAHAEGLEERVRVTVIARRADRPSLATSEGTARGDRSGDPPPIVLDAAAERDAIDQAVLTFISSVLDAKDTAQIRAVYQTPTDADRTARDEFVEDLLAPNHRNVRIVRPQSFAVPIIDGTNASTRGRIQLKWDRSLNRTGANPFVWLAVDLRRDRGGWKVISMRLSPAEP